MTDSLRKFWQQHAYLLVTLGLACVAAWPLLAEPGLLNTRGGGDSPFLLQRLHQLETAVYDGHFPVRWMPDANYGYGYPFYNFYAPLSLYITFFFRLLGFSFVRAIHLSQLAGFLVAAWGMYALVYRWTKQEWAALLSGVAYTVAPFHMVNVYVRGDSLAEFWAMAFYPLIILATDRLLQVERDNRRRDVAWLALSYAALILSHNISALIFSPFLGLFILLRLLHQRQLWRVVGWGVLALLLALSLAAWFFVPALAEQSLAQLGPVTEGYFHYSNHFRESDLIQTAVWFDYSVDGGNAFRMGWLQAVTAVAGLLLWLRQWRRTGDAIPLFILLTLSVATLMITPWSSFLWDSIPLLPFTQFPWRFLSVQALATALAAASLATASWATVSWAQLPRLNWFGPLLLLLLMGSGLGALQTDHLHLTDADVTPLQLARYEWFTGNIGSTVSAEYLPPTVQPRPYSSQWVELGQRNHVYAIEGRLNTAILDERTAVGQRWLVITDEPTTAVFPTLYWPGWQGERNGEQVAITAAPGSGLIALELPAGEHEVVLRLTRPPLRLAAELVSLTAVLILLWLLQPAWRPTAVVVGVLVLVGLIGQLRPTTTMASGDLTWDFAQMGYLHHDVGGVAFDNGSRLLGYDYSEEAVVGDSLTINLVWEGEAADATVALFTPAIHRTPTNQSSAPDFATESLQLQAGMNEVVLNVPLEVPAGLVVPRLVVAEATPLMESGQPRGHLFLRPIMLLPPSVVNRDKASLDVEAVTVAVADSVLTVQLRWLTQRVLSHNYNVSLRLLDSTGVAVTALDHQLGYGFTPSSLWPQGQWVNDWYTLDIHDKGGTPPYALVARLYDVATGEVVLTRRLGELDGAWQFQPTMPNFTLPKGIERVAADFYEGETAVLGMRGYELEQTDERLNLTLYWQGLAPNSIDYLRFVHLIPDDQGVPVAQNDAMPRQNSYPTTQWQVDEVVDERVVLSLAEVPPGQYRIAIGWYRRDEGFPRLTAVADDDVPLADNRLLLSPIISIP